MLSPRASSLFAHDPPVSHLRFTLKDPRNTGNVEPPQSTERRREDVEAIGRFLRRKKPGQEHPSKAAVRVVAKRPKQYRSSACTYDQVDNIPKFVDTRGYTTSRRMYGRKRSALSARHRPQFLHRQHRTAHVEQKRKPLRTDHVYQNDLNKRQMRNSALLLSSDFDDHTLGRALGNNDGSAVGRVLEGKDGNVRKTVSTIEAGPFEIYVKASGKQLHVDRGLVSTKTSLKSVMFRSHFIFKKAGADLWTITAEDGRPLQFNSSDKLIRVGTSDSSSCAFSLTPNCDDDDSYSIVLRPHPSGDHDEKEMSRMHGLRNEHSCNGFLLHVDGAVGGDSLLSTRFQINDDFSKFCLRRVNVETEQEENEEDTATEETETAQHEESEVETLRKALASQKAGFEAIVDEIRAKLVLAEEAQEKLLVDVDRLRLEAHGNSDETAEAVDEKDAEEDTVTSIRSDEVDPKRETIEETEDTATEAHDATTENGVSRRSMSSVLRNHMAFGMNTKLQALRAREEQLQVQLMKKAHAIHEIHASTDTDSSVDRSHREALLEKQSSVLQQQLNVVQDQRRSEIEDVGDLSRSERLASIDLNELWAKQEEAANKVQERLASKATGQIKPNLKWKSFLSGTKKPKGAGKTIARKQLRKTITEIYDNKIKNDIVDKQEGVETDFADFVIRFLLELYGTKKLVQRRLWELIGAVDRYFSSCPFVLAFARFAQLTGHDLDSHLLKNFTWGWEKFQKHTILLEKNEFSQSAAGFDVYKCVGDLGVIESQVGRKLLRETNSLFSYLPVDDAEIRSGRLAQFELDLKNRKSRKVQQRTCVLTDAIALSYLDAMEENQRGADEYYLTLFYSFDTNGDECLDYEEYKALVASASPTPVKEHLLRRWFMDLIAKTGSCSPDAFLELSRTKLHDFLSRTVMAAALDAVGADGAMLEENKKVDSLLTDGVRRKFQQYDTDGSLSMDLEELGKLLIDLGEPMGRQEITEVVEVLDKDGSGTVDLFEFMTWWRQVGIRSVFEKCDTDLSGKIETTELGKLFAEIGLLEHISADAVENNAGEQFLQQAMKQLDPNDDGQISFEEFFAFWCTFDAEEVFKKFDSDGSGKLTIGELNLVLRDIGLVLSPVELGEAIAILDADDSGELDFLEFYPWYKNVAKAKQEATRQETERYFEKRSERAANDVNLVQKGAADDSNMGKDPDSWMQVVKEKLIAVANEYNLPEEEVLLKFC